MGRTDRGRFLYRQLRKAMDHPHISRWGGRLVGRLVRAWMSTLEYRTCYTVDGVDPALPDFRQQKMIYIFWHEYIPFQLYLRGHCGVSMLLSQNRDAHFLSQAAHALGFGVVRGSTFQGALSGLRGLMRAARHQHLTITPDGPRGPRRRLAVGAIYLSSKLQMPLVALGMGYDRPYRLASWDRFAIPRPFSRARCIMGTPLQIPRCASASLLEQYRQQVEAELTRLTDAAESWALAGGHRAREVVTRRAPAFARDVPAAGRRRRTAESCQPEWR